MTDERYAPDPESPLPDPEPPTEREPRTGGDSATMAPVKIALALLVVFVVLLAVWALWPLVSGT
jgi:hypothetical protein